MYAINSPARSLRVAFPSRAALAALVLCLLVGQVAAACGRGGAASSYKASVVAHLHCKERPHNLFCSPDGRYCAAMVWHGNCIQPLGPTSIFVWETETWTLKRAFRSDIRFTCAAFARNGDKLVAGFGADSLTLSQPGGAVVWDVNSGHESLIVM